MIYLCIMNCITCQIFSNIIFFHLQKNMGQKGQGFNNKVNSVYSSLLNIYIHTKAYFFTSEHLITEYTNALVS